MNNSGFSHIRKWFWIFLSLVVLTSAIIFLFIHQEIMNALDGAVQLSRNSNSHGLQITAGAQLAALKLKLFILFTTGLIIIGSVGYLWIRIASRQVKRPIRVIQNAVARLASGKLNETVSLDIADEFGQIGAGLNELAANLQELLLYIWKQTGECNQLLTRINAKKSGNPGRQVPIADAAELKKLESTRRSPGPRAPTRSGRAACGFSVS